jgi:hypothetical protein
MTTTPPELPCAGPPVTTDPEDVDVMLLAGQRPPAEGQWLLVAEADRLPGSVFSAYVLPPDGRHGRGGDVLIRLTQATGTDGHDAIGVSIWAVISGRLVPVACWDLLDPDEWPEGIRQTAAFTLDMLTELEEHGADLRPRSRIDLDSAAVAVTPGIACRITTDPPGR